MRVIERTASSFRFVTLDGHLEAGQIRFAARRGELLEFSLESWARAGDRLSNLLYEHPRMSKEIQLNMWTSVLERVAELAEGRFRRRRDPHAASGRRGCVLSARWARCAARR